MSSDLHCLYVEMSKVRLRCWHEALKGPIDRILRLGMLRIYNFSQMFPTPADLDGWICHWRIVYIF